MAETDPAGSSRHHVVVIDVEAVAAAKDDGEAAAADDMPSSSCAVFMEAMEWVAVSPCGHREVCVRCAARIRFFHDDRRCCICRSHCATVVVTKATSTAITSRREREGFPFLWPPPAPPAFGGLGLVVGGYHWYYHPGMGAYFDDLSQYQAMSKVCSTTATTSSNSEESAGVGAGGVNQQAAASVNVVDLNVVSVPARQQADDAPMDLEQPLSRCQGTAAFILLAVAGLFIFGAPLLYMIPT